MTGADLRIFDVLRGDTLSHLVSMSSRGRH